MLLQALTDNPDAPSSTPKDPRNQHAISVLFMAVAPLAFAFFSPDLTRAVIHAVALAYFGVAFWCLSLGVRNRKTYEAQEICKRPRIPFLMVGAILIGLTFAGLIGTRGDGWASAAFQGVLASVLSLLAFGIDPLRDKVPKTAKDMRSHAAGELAKQARDRLLRIRRHVGQLNDTELTASVDALCHTGAKMVEALTQDPDRHREIRPYLGHYLDETAEVTTRFVMQFKATADAHMRAEYVDFLTFMEQAFTAELRKFVTEGRDSMDVQISALRTKLKR